MPHDKHFGPTRRVRAELVGRGEDAATFDHGAPVGGLPLAMMIERIDELVLIGKQILLHLEEMTGNTYEGDTDDHR